MVNEDKVPAAEARKGFLWGAKVLSYLVYVYLIFVEIILVLGFFLLLFGANPSAEFTQWAYRNLDRVMAPFRGIFTPIELGTTSGDVQAVFDTSVLFAMIIYGILALALSWLIHWLSDRLAHLKALEADAERRRIEQAQFEADAERRRFEQARLEALQAASGAQSSAGSASPTGAPYPPTGTPPPTSMPPGQYPPQ